MQKYKVCEIKECNKYLNFYTCILNDLRGINKNNILGGTCQLFFEPRAFLIPPGGKSLNYV
jgi:hypothetical protein